MISIFSALLSAAPRPVPNLDRFVPNPIDSHKFASDTRVMIFEFASAQDFLRAELQSRIRQNQRYSMRGFAKHLKISAGELSEILHGKRQLSFKSAQRISEALGLTPVEDQYLFQLVSNGKSSSLNPKSGKMNQVYERRQVLEDSTFQLLSDWYYFALLNLMDCKGFRWDTLWISKRLNITRTQAKMAMELLLKVGLVKESKGQYKVDHDIVLSPDGIPSEAVRNYHRQVLEKAKNSLEEQRPAERDITGVGFAMDPKYLPAIKKDIAAFQETLSAKYSKGQKTEVYHLETAFIRLTEGDHHEK